MSMFILTDGQVNRYWIVNVVEPEGVRIVPGEMDLKVEVVSFTRSMKAARERIISEMLKE